MRLKSLSLRQFRNIAHLEIKPEDTLNFFVGDNAQGKTSLLESIYYLSTLKSFRPCKISDLIKKDEDGFQLDAIFQTRSDLKLTSLKTRLQNGQRKLLINEKAVSAAKFISQMRVVVFSPDSLAAVKYGPDLRRNLIDQAVFQISTQAAQSQNDYLRALKQRNACLKQMRAGILGVEQGSAVLESLNPAFLRLASEVTFYRLELLQALTPYVEEILSQILGTSTEIQFAYESDEKPWIEREYSAIHDRLSQEAQDKLDNSIEQTLGLSLIGPHRHDLSFIFNKTDSRVFCSQGQQRALILSFKIAEIVYHGKVFDSFPLLLLDDVLSEFDEKKRRFLVDFLRTNNAQTFLTTADHAHVHENHGFFHMELGSVKYQRESSN